MLTNVRTSEPRDDEPRDDEPRDRGPETMSDGHLLHVADEQTDLPVDLERYARLVRHVLVAEQVPVDVELSVLFVDEDTIAEYHERFLGEPGPTDVMAFPIDDDLTPSGRHPDHGGRGPGAPDAIADEPPPILGDVMVCPAFAAREAAQRGVELVDELSLLVVHGVLHLLNYDHHEPNDELVMQRRQQELLDAFAASERGTEA